MTYRILAVLTMLVIHPVLYAQLSFSGYSEIYFTSDFSNDNNTRDLWFYNHNLNNTIAPNVAILESKYNSKGVRARLDLMFGSYAGAIMANEPNWALPLAQAYVGTDYKQFSFDMGIFESGIGMEGIKGAENPTLTRSLVAENTPYFLTGLRTRWEDRTGVIRLEGAIINGWETVTRHTQNSHPGAMFRFRLGSNKVQLRYHFLYTNDRGGYMVPTDGMINGFTFKHALNSWQWFLGYDNVQWSGDAVHMPHLIIRKEFSETWAAAVRGEYVLDQSLNFMSPVEETIIFSDRELSVWGTSFNVDYMPRKNLTLRAEIRYLEGQIDRFFDLAQLAPGSSLLTSTQAYENISFTVAACVSF